MSGKTRWIIAVLVVGNLAMLFVVLVLFVSNANLLPTILDFSVQDSPEMRVEVRAPGVVEVGDAFELFVVVENVGRKNLIVEEIRLPRTLLDAALVNDVFPGTLTQEHDESGTGFKIDFILGAQDFREFRFRMQAIAALDFAGEIEVRADRARAASGTRLVFSEPGAEPVVEMTSTAVPPSAVEIPFQSVVKITALYLENGRLQEGWSGSGSIISDDGLILTNAHVVLPDKFFPVDAIKVSLTNEPDQLPVDSFFAEVLQADWELDIAILRVVSDLDEKPIDAVQLGLPAVPLGDSDQVQLGDSLLILGYPGIGGATITLTRGEVSGFTGDATLGERAFFKTSATIAGGNSGGLVVDQGGRLVAIPTQLGYGGEDQFVDCRVIVDTNRDGIVDERDSCVPTGGFINALRPINLALPMIEAARRGESLIIEQPKPDITLPQGRVVLYQDQFSDMDSGWPHDKDEGGFVGYKNSEYVVEVDLENYLYWGVPDETFSDLILTVDTRVVTPAEDAEFGVICRLRDNENFYGMSLTSEGWYSIWKLEDDEFTMLLDWDYSRDIPQYDAFTITAACISNQLTLAVDSIVLGQVIDYTFSRGDIGLFAGTWEVAGLSVAFDNLVVHSP